MSEQTPNTNQKIVAEARAYSAWLKGDGPGPTTVEGTRPSRMVDILAEALESALERLRTVEAERDAALAGTEWGVAYQQRDGLFVDEAVDEADARFRVENSSAYDLVVSRSVGRWVPVALSVPVVEDTDGH